MTSSPTVFPVADASFSASEFHSADPVLLQFIDAQKNAFARALNVLINTHTITATRTFQAFVRVPNSNYVLALNPPDLWQGEIAPRAVVATFEGEVIVGNTRAGGAGRRYAAVFEANPQVNVVIHFHGAYLGAWSSAHRTLPLLYAPAQRHTQAREIPIFIDRRAGEPAFINEVLTAHPNVPAILEANGGATFWGDDIISVSQYIVILEEGAYFQAIAETLGGSKEFGPGTLEQQWAMGFAKIKPCLHKNCSWQSLQTCFHDADFRPALRKIPQLESLIWDAPWLQKLTLCLIDSIAMHRSQFLWSIYVD